MAVLRELKRGGQVYFLHNEVETKVKDRVHYVRDILKALAGRLHHPPHQFRATGAGGGAVRAG
jgi:transcription-repair coupling factor (superfamily II helicase)